MINKIRLLNPDPTKKGATIDESKYETVKEVILGIIDERGIITFKELISEVVHQLKPNFEDSPSWYCTAEKLDLEAKGIIERIAGSKPQKVKRKWDNDMEQVHQDTINQEEVSEFIKKSINLLKEKYVFPDSAEEIAKVLEANLTQGKYNRSYTFDEIKEVMNADLQNVNGDKHLHIWIQEENVQDSSEITNEEMEEEYKRIAEKNNYGFHRIERLPGNIGYIDLRVFYDNAIASETAANAMNSLIHTDALLFDIRKNIGGTAYMVAMLASYLLKEPTHIESFYNREDDSTSQVWTLPYVPGKLYGDKPVYIITSKKTFSAGEMFSYALKHLGIATVIGENTGGGANPGHYHQVTKHLRLFVPGGRPISPFTGTNWDGTGVEPDIKVPAEDAFEVAYEKALLDVKKKYQEQPGYAFLVNEVEEELQKCVKKD